MTLNGSVIHEPALTVNVNQGATLALGFDERIGDNAVANINGTLTLNGTETVTTFNLNGTGSTLNGTGLVLAETYNLANGATTEEGANLGSGGVKKCVCVHAWVRRDAHRFDSQP